ncbi:hypothetical protein EVAR_35637_1 [Eumeta japonica]|uniref:Uncharacterized protein n=1 Tax=Eumeta variegata TaxID=151549 RepID=A0A4C1WFW7_EUMVA|nr:hypothetical protein EVAR_35637_1 [Eumeta japonica]
MSTIKQSLSGRRASCRGWSKRACELPENKVFLAAHGHYNLLRRHQCGVGLEGKSRISNERSIDRGDWGT